MSSKNFAKNYVFATFLLVFRAVIGYGMPVEMAKQSFRYKQRQELIGKDYCFSVHSLEAGCFVYSKKLIGNTQYVRFPLPCSGTFRFQIDVSTDKQYIETNVLYRSSLPACSQKDCISPKALSTACSDDTDPTDVSLKVSTPRITTDRGNTNELTGISSWAYLGIVAVAVIVIAIVVLIFVLCKYKDKLPCKAAHAKMSTEESQNYTDSATLPMIKSSGTLDSADQGIAGSTDQGNGPSSTSGSSGNLTDNEERPIPGPDEGQSKRLSEEENRRKDELSRFNMEYGENRAHLPMKELEERDVGRNRMSGSELMDNSSCLPSTQQRPESI